MLVFGLEGLGLEPKVKPNGC